MEAKMSFKDYTLAVLNGNATAVLVALMPAALLNGILSLMEPSTITETLSFMVNLAQTALPVIAGMLVGLLLKLAPLESASMSLATLIGSGIAVAQKGQFVFTGTGVILNIMLTSFIAGFIAMTLQQYLGSMRVILNPTAILLTGGSIGLFTLPYTLAVQTWIGDLVAKSTSLSPLLMGMTLGIAFAILIVSPLSSVGIATAISISGVGSGSANTGIVAGAMTLALIGASVNPIGGTIAQVFGSPKIQMANILEKPKLFLPIIISAGATGLVSAALEIKGTAFSAGFGASGFVGPITAFQESTGANIGLRLLIVYIFMPVGMAVLMRIIFVKVLKLIQPSDLKLPEV